jgi:hypothetical protein
MESQSREQFVVVIAGLLGVIVGQVLKKATTPEPEREEATFTAIDMPTLVATPGLGLIAGEVIGIDEESLPARAAVTFATGATLAYFAEVIGRRLPGVIPSGGAGSKE